MLIARLTVIVEIPNILTINLYIYIYLLHHYEICQAAIAGSGSAPYGNAAKHTHRYMDIYENMDLISGVFLKGVILKWLKEATVLWRFGLCDDLIVIDHA